MTGIKAEWSRTSSLGSLAARRWGRRRALGLMAAGAGATGLLAACRTKGSGSPAPGGGGPAAQAKPGGELNIQLATEPSDLDPTGKPSLLTPVLPLACDSLLSFAIGPKIDYNDVRLVPGLAEKWETPDGLTFTFHLVKGAKFASLAPVNGREVTSADAKWSMEYITRTGSFKNDSKLLPSQYAALFGGLSGIETPDATTVVVKFTEPFAPFLTYSAAIGSGPIIAGPFLTRVRWRSTGSATLCLSAFS